MPSRAGLKPQVIKSLRVRSFRNVLLLETWLERQQETAPGVWLRLMRKGHTSDALTKMQAIDAALCHGWIDGQTLKYDELSYLVRFTPRRPRSGWSQVNRARATLLEASGKMKPQGLRQVNAARADGRWDAAYSSASTVEVPADLQRALTAHPEAASRFEALSRVDRYSVLHALEIVKKAETRQRRIQRFVQPSISLRKDLSEQSISSRS